MSPYRIAAREQPPSRPPQRLPDEDALVLFLWLLVSLLGLVPQLYSGGSWGSQSSLALLLAVVSASALVHRWIK